MAADKKEEETLKGQEKFGADMLYTFPKNSDNILYSPFAIHGVLSLLSQSACSESRDALTKMILVQNPDTAIETYESLINYMHSLNDIELINNTTIYISNDYKLRPSLEKIIEKLGFTVEILDFNDSERIEAINASLVSCREALSSDDTRLEPNDKLVIVNTLSFKAQWACSFGEQDETPELDEFSVNETEKIGVHMMNRAHVYKMKTDDELNVQVIEIPFVNKELSMVIVLPTEEFGIDALESKLCSVDLNRITQDLETQFSYVVIPKFKITRTMNLNERLKILGLGDIFEPEKCNLSGMVENPNPVAVDKIIQKVCFEIDENGNPPPSPPRSPEGHCYCRVLEGHFRANHPFMVYVKSHGKYPCIILQGKVMRPTI